MNNLKIWCPKCSGSGKIGKANCYKCSGIGYTLADHSQSDINELRLKFMIRVMEWYDYDDPDNLICECCHKCLNSDVLDVPLDRYAINSCWYWDYKCPHCDERIKQEVSNEVKS